MGENPAFLKGILEIKRYELYSLALDDKTDIADISHIFIFFRTINEEFEIHNELLELKLWEISRKQIDMSKAQDDTVPKY